MGASDVRPRPRMRIVYVVFGASGGMFHYAQQLVSAASGDAAASLVVKNGGGPAVANDERARGGFAGDWLGRISRRFEKYSARQYLDLADRIVDGAAPDIVHITSPSVGLDPLVGRLKQHGVAVVYTIHDPIPHDEVRTTLGKIHSAYHARIELPRVLCHCSAIHVH